MIFRRNTIEFSKDEIARALADPTASYLDPRGPAASIFVGLGVLTGNYGEQDYTAVKVTLVFPKKRWWSRGTS